MVIGVVLAWSQEPTVRVDGSVTLVRKAASKGAADHSGVVVWLKPLTGMVTPEPRRLTMKQHHKRFDPHVLAVPVGSQVSFPNFDPFLHNVFSMFDGKRFDLGLYESGAAHTVKFDRPGMCYIFCNIHPEMSAVVIVLDTPYYAVSDGGGRFSIADVPAGRYTVNVWHERAKPENPREFPHEITLGAPRSEVMVIRLVDSGQLLAPHKNKYGKEYDPVPGTIYK